MSSIDLMILGLIKAKPRSAYEINRLVEINKINTWIKISPRAVYRNIRELAKKGYIAGEKRKEGNMPEKMIYSITDNGKDFFLELMTRLSKISIFQFEACHLLSKVSVSCKSAISITIPSPNSN